MENEDVEIVWDFQTNTTTIKDNRYETKYLFEIQERNYKEHGIKCFIKWFANGELLKEGLFNTTQNDFIKKILKEE